MGIYAALTTTVTLNHSAGTSTPPISPLILKDASINTHKTPESTSGGSLKLAMPSMMQFTMASFARLAGLGIQMEAPLLNVLISQRLTQIKAPK